MARNTYFEKRERVHKSFMSILGKHNLANYLIGSWLNQDFHLSQNSMFSYSDVDFCIPNIRESEKLDIINLLDDEFSSLFDNKLKISIHSKNSLSKMNFTDAKILALGEYIAMYKKYIITHTVPKDYFLAKFILLLSRTNDNETYKDVLTRMANASIRHCYMIKLGFADLLDDTIIENIKKIKYEDDLVNYFIDNVYYKNPDDYFENQVINQLFKAHSIDAWLRDYLISKMQFSSNPS